MEKIIVSSESELKQIIEETIKKVLFESEKVHKEEPETKSLYADVEEASKYLKIAKQTLYGLTSRNEIPFIKRGRKLLFLISDIDQWLLSSRKPSRTEIKNSIFNPK